MKKKRAVLIAGIAIALFALVATGLLGLVLRASAKQDTQAPLPPVQTRNITLYVRDTTITMPDGVKIYAFGYTDDPKGHAQVPGPVITVNQGDTVNLTLVDDHDPTNTQFNSGGDGHTIHLHGLDLPPEFDGDPMTAPGGHGVMQGEHYTYHFVAKQPGTYWYHCHVEAAEHIQMGMYGAIIIRPRGDAQRAYPATPAFDKAYTFVLSEMDSTAHQDDYNHLYHNTDDVNWTNYHANYFLINGKAFPDTMKDPQDAITGKLGQTVLVRLINAGYESHSMHTHGFHFLVIGSDGRTLDQPLSKDTIDIAPGERYDILLKLDQVGNFMFHDHYEQNTTNDGAYPGGMMTMITVTP